ncbi:MAG TPA: crossover junction endodeoxyribonuclease RuvC [Syntrophorhabdaceae bacterium]|nr:crossover junction endodeoxyribonuclease RuvC [Syntrophorhabdaceae bacterium]
MIILGLDPGLASTGFGLIKATNNSPTLLKCGYIKTYQKDNISVRLFQIYSDLNTLIEEEFPDMMAVENVFSLVRYPKAGILLGCVIGIIYIIASDKKIKLVEVTPKEVKNSLIGYGNADKRQIKKMVQHIFNIDQIRSFHAADALAIALTAFYRVKKENLL